MRPLKIKPTGPLAFSPHAPLLATMGERSVVLWDLETRKPRWRARPLPYLSGLAFSPDGNLLAVKNCDGQIVVLEADTGALICDFENFEDGEGARPCFNATGRYVISGSWDGQIVTCDVRSGAVKQRISLPGHMIEQVLCSEVDGSLWVRHGKKWTRTSPPKSFLSSWPSVSRGFQKTTEIKLDRVASVAVSVDGTIVVGHDKTVSTLHRKKASPLVELDDHILRLAAHPTMNGVGVTSMKQVWYINLDDGEALKIADADFPHTVSFTRDCSTVAIASEPAGTVMDLLLPVNA